jgi:hypothetical protein
MGPRRRPVAGPSPLTLLRNFSIFSKFFPPIFRTQIRPCAALQTERHVSNGWARSPSSSAVCHQRKETMMYCGSRRSTGRNTSAPASPSVPQGAQIAGAPRPIPAATTLGQFPTVTIHYVETAPIRVRGSVTGWHYEFSGAESHREVDVRDAAVLTGCGPFRR